MPNNDPLKDDVMVYNQNIPNFKESIYDTIVLAFDVKDVIGENIDKYLDNALRSAEVKAAIRNSLVQFANTKIASKTSIISVQEFKDFKNDFYKQVSSNTKNIIKKQIESTSEYKNFQESLDILNKSFMQTTKIGAFLDKHKKKFYIFGPAVVLGGLGAMYLSPMGKAGINNVLQWMENKPIVIPVGKFEYSPTILKFNPDARIFGGELGVKAELKRVKMNFNLGVTAEGSKLQEIKGGAIIKYQSFSLNSTFDFKPSSSDVNLTVKMGGDNDKMKLSLGAEVHNKDFKGSFNGTYQPNKNTTFGIKSNIYGNINGKLMSDVLISFKKTF